MFTRRTGNQFLSSPRSTTRSPLRALGLAGAVLLSTATVPGFARAADSSADKRKVTYGEFAKMDPMKAAKMMDADSKGYVTREEFLKFQEKLFDNIPKQTPDRVTMQEWRAQASYRERNE